MTGPPDPVTEVVRALCGLVFHLLEAATDLGRPEASVSTERADGRDLPGAGPAGDRLGVDLEQLRNLAGGQQLVAHFRLLEAFLVLLHSAECRLCRTWHVRVIFRLARNDQTP